MRRPHAHPFRLSTLVLVVGLLAGCNTVFRDAMARGDAAAEANRWDEAAAAYAEAVAADPDDEEARLDLGHARRQQALIRVARGEALLKEGRSSEALTPLAEAVRLDPFGLEAKNALGRAKTQVLAEAEQALVENRDKHAYQLARAFLRVDPQHERMNEIDSIARQKVADSAVSRGNALEKSGNISLALVDFGEAIQYVPGHPKALERAAVLRKSLREQVTYIVALKNFDGEQNADDLGSDVDAAALANGMDPALALRIVDTLPKPPAYRLQGMRLGGLFRGYQFKHTSSASNRSCDYICGTELVENPAYAGAQASMRAAHRALASAESRRAAARIAVGPAQQERNRMQTEQARAALEASRAEQDLAACRALGSPPGQANTCGTEQARRDRASSDLQLANDALSRAASVAANAESELADAERDLAAKQGDAANKKLTFEQTPAKVSVDKHCLHNYRVDTHFVNGDVEVKLKGEGLYDTEVVLNRSVNGRVARQDDTFPAQAGVCAEVAQADPLTVPSEPDTKKLLLASAIDETQKELVSAFDRYRGGYLNRGNTAVADGRPDQAADQLVRYLSVMGLGDNAALDAAVADIARLREVDSRAVRLGVWGAE
jgi:tetratricopeptide (TPR) repeat protein